MAILFSIIIPVYNSEKYVSSSVKSILKQSFSKNRYEIILINDCSNDNSKLIIENLKKKFKFIKVINNKKNYKVSYCRNIGIKKAKGKYILFLDSDDELKKNSFNRIEKLLSKYEYDVILSLEFKSNKKRMDTKKINQIKNIDYFLNYENKHQIYNPNCWNMVLNKSFLEENKIFFKKIEIFEDQIFCTEVLFSTNKVKVIPTTFHKYIQRSTSLSRNTNYLALKSCFLVLINLLEILKISKLSKSKSIFINNRINFIVKLFKNYINVCSESQIKKIILNFKKFAHKDKINNNIYFKKAIETKKKFFQIKNLMKLRNKFVSKLKNFSFHNYNKIYIFCFGVIGRSVFHILKESNIKIDGFIDNNRDLSGSEYFGKKIFKPKHLVNTINHRSNNTLIVISQNLIKTSDKIVQQLNNLNLKKTSIKTINTF